MGRPGGWANGFRVNAQITVLLAGFLLALRGEEAIIAPKYRDGACARRREYRMQKKGIFALALVLVTGYAAGATGDYPGATGFAGQDLHLVGTEVINYQLSTGEHALVFENGFSMSIGANHFESAKAVVWLMPVRTQVRGMQETDYQATVYLEQNVTVGKNRLSKTTDVTQTMLEGGEALLSRFLVTGEVFITADKRTAEDPHRLELYRTALSYSKSVESGPRFVVQEEALVPELPARAAPQQEIVTEEGKPAEPEAAKEEQPGLLERVFGPEQKVEPVQPEPKFSYPVVFAPAGPEPLKIDSVPAPDGTNVATIRQRFYVSQKQDEQGRLLELQADNAVVFYSGSGERNEEKDGSDLQDLLSRASVRAIYLSGDVVMAEGQRTIRADEIFYDFERKKAIAINAVMRNFDDDRGIPIYVRAAQLRQLSENKFSANNVVLTTSEFYVPQMSVSASSVVITDTTTVDEQLGRMSDASYDAELRDVKVKYKDFTLFGLPVMRSNFQRPDAPLQSVHAGYDSTWGPSFETRWFLARLLGMKESPGTESRFMLDYYGKRGLGTGAEIEYVHQDSYGRMFGYLIHDHGEDRLGSWRFRKDLEPPRKFRGRFSWQHRQLLADDWQLTTGVDYSSDENFVEQYWRNEFDLSDRETYVHLKKSRDNWALSLLGKGRINDFEDRLEELPSGEFHLTGQSLFDDKLTLYSDSQVSHLRQRIGNDHAILITQQPFTFMAHRTELDMPMWLRPFKVVPYVAGTLAYDDRSGFERGLVDLSHTRKTAMGNPSQAPFGGDCQWIMEAGLRLGTQLWKTYPNVKSRLWDLQGLRHIVEPHLLATVFTESDVNIKQRDLLNVGVAQRWQTKRGPAGQERTVDWMRLDLDSVWLNENERASDAGPGPDRLTWAKPFVPMRVFSAPQIFNGDLTMPIPTVEMWGPRRDYFSADYIWRVSDTTAVLSDMYYDTRSGVVNQMNVGFSRLVWPNLSYYIGSRYLRRVQVLGEKGSQAFTFAATYELDPRYTLVFAQQVDFDYGSNIRSDVTLIRKYHRLFWGITYSADNSLDTQSFVVSIWPQGIPELSLGHRRYSEMAKQPSY